MKAGRPGRSGTPPETELELIRSHPRIGARIGEALGMHRRELEVIRHHHERWDGEGYPDGLSGEDLPKLARVLALADVYDALTSDRSYRKAWTPDQAREHIAQEAGRSFDPALVRAWIESLDSQPAHESRVRVAGGAALLGRRRPAPGTK